MDIRTITSEDYEMVTSVLNEWWGGRQMKDKLPRLFFGTFSGHKLYHVRAGGNDRFFNRFSVTIRP